MLAALASLARLLGVTCLVVVSIPLFLYLLFRVRKCYRGWRPRGTRPLPTPPRLPFLGHTLELYRTRRHTLQQFQKWVEEYGNTYRFTLLGDRDIVLINDPESIRHVLSTKFRAGVYGKGPYQQEQYRDLIGMGIFNSNPPLWKEQRRCAAALFTADALKQHVSVFQRHASILCSELLRLRSEGSLDPQSPYATRGVDVQEFFLRYTMDSFAEIGFGHALHSLTYREGPKTPFSDAFDYLQSKCFQRMDYGELWPAIMPANDTFRRKLATMDRVVRDCIGQAEQKSYQELLEQQVRHPTLLTQTLLTMHDESTGARNASFSPEVLRDTCVNFLIAGRDTTALMLSWFWYLIANHPHVEEKIREEMEEVLGGDEAALRLLRKQQQQHDSTTTSSSTDPAVPLPPPATYDQLKRLPYLHQALLESLRLYPPVPFNGFTALKDDILPGGFFVPAQTYVTYSAYLLHRRPDLYGPDPESFRPERWHDAPPRPYEFVAFHGGPRECMGREMAMLEAKVAIVTMMRGCAGEPATSDQQLGHHHVHEAPLQPTQPFTLRMHPDTKVELKRAIILTARKGMHMTLHDVET